MEDIGVDEYRPVTILDVLGVGLCARAILQHVHVAQLVRSERVSRRWQRAVVDYLRTCRTLSYTDFRYGPLEFFENRKPVLIKTFHRTISINNLHSLPLVRKTLDKWGPYITTVISNLRKDTYFDTVVSKCTNLKHFEIFLDMHCENITISNNLDLDGSFLESLKSGLKSLRLTEYFSLSVTSGLRAAIDNMKEMALMPQLEELTLNFKQNWYPYFSAMRVSDECILGFSRLDNLKRLTIVDSEGGKVTEAFLEVLARECRKLEYLKILNTNESVTAGGVMALCCRSPSARTTLHFSDSDHGFEIYYLNFFDFKNMPLYKELAALGCVELTPEWFEATCRDPRGWELRLNPGLGSRAKEQEELKLIIF